MKPAAAVCLLLGVAVAVWAARKLPPAEWVRAMGRREGKLRPGDPAPDFNLKLLDSGRTVQLAAFRGKKPVALVFGSYT